MLQINTELTSRQLHCFLVLLAEQAYWLNKPNILPATVSGQLGYELEIFCKWQSLEVWQVCQLMARVPIDAYLGSMCAFRFRVRVPPLCGYMETHLHLSLFWSLASAESAFPDCAGRASNSTLKARFFLENLAWLIA